MKNNSLTKFVMLSLFVTASFTVAQTDSTTAAVNADTTITATTDTTAIAAEVAPAPEALVAPAAPQKTKQKFTGPMPCASVNSHNGSLVPVGTYVYINKYFNVNKDELIVGTETTDTPSIGYQNFTYQEVQNAFRMGVIKGVDVRLITSYFSKSMDNIVATDTLGGNETQTYTNSGLGDFKLIGRYSIMNQKTGPANVIVGIGVTIPIEGDSRG